MHHMIRLENQNTKSQRISFFVHLLSELKIRLFCVIMLMENGRTKDWGIALIVAFWSRESLGLFKADFPQRHAFPKGLCSRWLPGLQVSRAWCREFDIFVSNWKNQTMSRSDKRDCFISIIHTIPNVHGICQPGGSIPGWGFTTEALLGTM